MKSIINILLILKIHKNKNKRMPFQHSFLFTFYEIRNKKTTCSNY